MTLFAESQSQSLDFGQSELTDFIKNAIVYDGHRFSFLALNYKPVWYFELILEQIVSICYLYASNNKHISAQVQCDP